MAKHALIGIKFRIYDYLKRVTIGQSHEIINIVIYKNNMMLRQQTCSLDFNYTNHLHYIHNSSRYLLFNYLNLAKESNPICGKKLFMSYFSVSKSATYGAYFPINKSEISSKNLIY